MTAAGSQTFQRPFPPRIALIGFMGSGKTTIGRLLAERLGYRFLDLDTAVVQQAGMSIREIFEQQGEEAFRRTETEILYSLREEDRLVIAAGGGSPIRKQNREFFESLAATVYLEVSFQGFLKRTGKDPSRPLLDKAPAELKELYLSRLPVYRSLARPIRTDGRHPEDTVAKILKQLGGKERGRGAASRRAWSSASATGGARTSQKARSMLFRGKVVRGNERGKRLGVPTANLDLTSDELPQTGVYAAWARIEGEPAWRPAVVNFGVNPTFGEHTKKLEVYLLDFSGDLYGRTLEVAPADYLRPEKKYRTPAALVRQMRKDGRRARKLLAGAEPPAPTR
jgi:shikimate kinase